MITLSESGTHIFSAHNAWREHCIKCGITDPWKMEREIEDEYTHHGEEIINGVKAMTISYDEPTEEQKKRLRECHEYRDEYMCDREKWIGDYIFKNFGYNDLTIFAQSHSKRKSALKCDKVFWQWFKTIYPCEGKEGQCTFSCPVFHNCPYYEQGIYRKNLGD